MKVGSRTYTHYTKATQLLSIIILAFLYPSLVQAQNLSADFTLNRTEGCIPLIVQFTNTTTGNPESCSWNFGNGNQSAECSPVATFTSSGEFTVTLTVRRGAEIKTVSKIVTVFPSPQPRFTADVRGGCAPLSVNFTDQSISNLSPIVNWIWDFGDGRSSSQRNPTQTYLGENSFNVSLIVTDANGCRGFYTEPNYITATSTPNVDFTTEAPDACRLPFSLGLQNLSQSNYLLNFKWEFGNGDTSALRNPEAIYDNVGIFPIKLSAVNPFGCAQSITKDVEIKLVPFTPTMSIPTTSGCAPLNVSYSATANSTITINRWNFGNGQTGSAASGIVTYDMPGDYILRGEFENEQGCREVRTQLIRVFPKPVADFTASPLEACQAPLDVNFNVLTPDVSTVRWNFGDGTNSTALSPNKIFTQQRTYNITMFVTNSFGCSDTLLKRDYVKIQAPFLDIATTNPLGCLPLNSNFEVVKTGPGTISTINWNFGNGNTHSGIIPPLQTYNTQGSFNVRAEVVFSDNCNTQILQREITAGNRPVFTGTVTPLEVCVKRPSVRVVATGGNLETIFTWHFGDGGVKDGPVTAYEYSEPGDFNVSLVGTNFGCKDSIFINRVKVLPPVANFRINTNCGGLNLSFRNTSIGNTTSSWDFGDGSPTLNDNATIVNHTFPSLGDYDVKLIVTNAQSGCVDTMIQSIKLDNLRPQMTQAPQIGCAPFLVNLSDTNSIFRTITWSLGDTLITGKSAQRLFGDPGQYSVRAFTVDQIGCRDTFNFNNLIRVVDIVPDFDFSPIGGCAPIEVNFRDRSTTQFSNINRWSWDFAGFGNASTRNPRFTFTQNDSMLVRLRVTDNIGCFNIVEKKVPVLEPVADFTSELTSICTDLDFKFQNTSTGVGLTYFWNFGDGINTSTDTNPSNIYRETGSFDISLIVTDANNCRDSIVKTSYVKVENFTYDFDAAPRFKTCPELLTTFEISPPNILYKQAFWDFGNGNQSLDTSRFPTNIYVESGLFDVGLILEDYRGCKDTIFKDDFIEVKGPRGDITFTPVSGCAPLTVEFQGEYINSRENFWDFGDGNGLFDASLSPTVTHTYQAGGIARPSLVLDDGLGCIVLIEADPIFVSKVDIEIEADKSGMCSGETITLKNLSTTDSFAPIVTSFWELSDGRQFSDSVVSLTFNTDTTAVFWIKLNASSAYNCFEVDSFPVKVYAAPIIQAADDKIICGGDEVMLGVSGASSYKWSPENSLRNANSPNPIAKPFENTTYVVMGYDTITCPSFDSLNVRVLKGFEATAGPDSRLCMGDTIQLFTEVSEINSGNFTYRWTPNVNISDTSSANPTVWPSNDITYTVEIKNGSCAEFVYPVFVNVLASPTVRASEDATIFRGQSVKLSALATDGVQYSWSPNYKIDCQDCPFPIVNPDVDTTYTVRVLNDIGCVSIDEVRVDVYPNCSGDNVIVPNTFTPNNDGLNDVFYARGKGLSNIRSFRIYNRWGHLLFESSDIEQGWDGTYNGVPLNSDVFVYYLELICLDGQTSLIKGNITLLK